MVEIVCLIFAVAVLLFIYLKNKQQNRVIDRRNRLQEKQEELIEMLRQNNKTENKDDNENRLHKI